MANTDDEIWRQFDEIDRRRARDSRRRQDAFRRLGRLSAERWDEDARNAWKEYCDSADRLEKSLDELEALLWRMK